MSDSHINYVPRPDATPEAELDALAAIYRYVLFDLQASRGGQHDLTSKTTPEHFGKRLLNEQEGENLTWRS